jgi:hypothetical protein
MRSSKALDSSGYLKIHVLASCKVLLPPPSIIYAKSVHGAPQNPISGTSPLSSVLVLVIASKTYFSSLLTSTTGDSLLTSAGVTRGLGNCGPGFMRTSIPMAWGMTRMSLKIIDASRRPVYRWMGCKVIFVASSGVLHTSKNSCDFRTSRNSVEEILVLRASENEIDLTRKIASRLSHHPDRRAFCFFP